MKLKSNLKRFASLMLSAALVLTCIPLCAAAEEAATPSDITGTEVIVLPAEEQALPPVEEAPDESASDAPDEPSHDEMLPNSEEESSSDDRHPLQAAIEEHGYVYVRTVRAVSVYASAESQERIVYAAADDASILLATAFFSGHQAVQVWFLDAEQQTICGFVPAASLDTRYLTDADVSGIADVPSCDGMTAFGQKRLFVVNGSRPEEASDEEETPADAPSQDVLNQEPNLPEADESGASEQPDAAESPDASVHPEISSAEEIDETVPPVNPGDFVSVSTDTRVFSAVDDDASETYFSSEYQGNFVKAAAVQVVSVAEDASGTAWYQVRFLYGDSFPSGKMKWTADEMVWVMAAETGETDADACTVTDFAYPKEMLRLLREMQTYTAETDGFSLKNIHGKIGSFQAGQSGLQGSSGRDAAYPQLAKSASHGTIYATPHYLESYPVYCLEHTLSGPGEGSGANKTETGPYALLDMETFVNTAEGGGVNGVRFKAQTMHAIGWVLRHTYPFMVLDRNDANNEVWSRVAGQFAIREVIKQLEGAQYVRSYWDMDNFYAFSGGAPEVYLTYARWLAKNAIAHAKITGKITVSGQRIQASDGGYIGTVTLTTDADLIRISKAAGSITGNSGGSDEAYYYVKSGDTIRILSDKSSFSVYMESIASSAEEAGFLVGIPSASIQKVLVPIEGTPYPLQSAVVTFELLYGTVFVTKQSMDGILLQGAVFELLDESGAVLAEAVTDAQGRAVFSGIAPGRYQVREKTAPQGYRLSVVSAQEIMVTAGADTACMFINERMMGIIRVIKTDSMTGKPLPGVTFTVMRLTAPASDNASNIGKVVATITTNADGIAQTEALPWGEYRIAETNALDGYVDTDLCDHRSNQITGGRKMKRMKQWMHWVLALVLLVLSLSVPTAAAETITVNVTNTPVRGSVALEKTGLQLVRFTDEQDEWGNTVMKPVYQQGYLTGAVFELRAAADVVGKEGTVFYKQGELVETLTTSADGAVNSKLLPLGSYCLQEVSAPDGYLLDDTPYPFTLTAAGKQTAVVEVKVSAVNTYLPIRVTLHKQQEAIRVDETADGMIRSSIETVPGEGCVFGLFNAGVIAYGDSQKLPAHTLMATGITDAKGNLTFSGMYPHGAYYVKELSAPDGWLLNTEQYPVLLTPENMDEAEEAIAITLDAPILNRLIYTPVTITKRDVAGKETLPGALIEVYDAQGSTIYRAYTDENGQLPDIPLVPGSYTFKETYAPEGYALNVAVKTFTVTSEGKIIGETEIRDEINKIQLKKVKENGEPLPGAVFGIYDANNTLVQQQTSDDSGYLTFSKLGYGTYTIREIQAPYGYHPSTGEWQVTIDGTYQNPVQILTTVVNEDAPGWIRVIKTDALDGHPIAGVRFDIYALNEDGSTGDLVSTMLTNDDGVAMSESLLVGDYMVKEHEAPVGYVNSLWSEKVTVVMDETVERSVTNIPMQGQVRIVKTDAETGGSLAGAVFTVIRVSGLPSHGKEGCGEVVAVITTDAEGVAVTPVLTWGIYEIRETTVPDGYLDSGCVVTVSIPGNAD